MSLSGSCPAAIGEIYNISGDKAVTFDGLAKACAIAAGQDPDKLNLIHYDPKAFDFGKKKAFPMRPQHFFCSVDKAKRDLNWVPKFDLIAGLKDSLHNDYLKSGRKDSAIDFSTDDLILG